MTERILNGLILVISAAAFTAAVCNALRRKKALFLQIIVGGTACLLLCSLFLLLETLILKANEPFSVSTLANAGFCLFLLSADYGALDSLADDRSVEIRRFRLISLCAPAAVAAVYVAAILLGGNVAASVISACVLCPLAYFTLKHLLIPDIELGFVRALRPYNLCVAAIILLQCASDLLRALSMPVASTAVFAAVCAAAAVMSVFSRRGVEQWYI